MSMMPNELNSRPSLLPLDTSPVIDENFDLMLLRADAVVSVPTAKEGIGQTVLGAVREYLRCPDADFLAVALPECDRVALVAPLPAASMGEAVAVLAHIGAHSMTRVLRYAFADQVRLCGDFEPYGNEHIRAADESTYQYLQVLLSRCRMVLGGAAPIPITDRKQLSQQIIATARRMELLFGRKLEGAELREFPVVFAYEGVFYPTRALWMLLNLTLGIMWGCSKRARESMRPVFDEELLLPMLEMSAGNKMRLPPEWEECRRVAEREGMFFDVRRRRDAIRVRFCPMTPRIAPQEFYSVRAMAPIVEGIREMKLK